MATGHENRNCPEKDKGAKCYRCTQFFHISTSCSKGKEAAAARRLNTQLNVASDEEPAGETERLRGAGGPIFTPGKVVLLTKIDGVEYTLEYRVVPRTSIPEKVILGLRNQAII